MSPKATRPGHKKAQVVKPGLLCLTQGDKSNILDVQKQDVHIIHQTYNQVNQYSPRLLFLPQLSYVSALMCVPLGFVVEAVQVAPTPQLSSKGITGAGPFTEGKDAEDRRQ